MTVTTASNYDETLADIEERIGFVPGFMEALPTEELIREWPAFKRYTLSESEIKPKDRELIKLAVATNIECPPYQTFHQGMAQRHGATAQEVNEVAVLADLTARWSEMIHAQNYDYDTFIGEFERIDGFVHSGYETRFKVLDRSLGAAEESAKVIVEDGTVAVTGTIVGNDTCYTARLAGMTVEEGTLVIRVESYDDADDEACADALIRIEYEVIVEFGSKPPASVRVEHNNEPVATEERIYRQPGHETRFTMLNGNSQLAAEDSASVTVEDGTVTVTGTIVGNNDCYWARFEGATVEGGTLVARVESYDPVAAGEIIPIRACEQVLIGIAYEAVIQFDNEPSASIRVEHNGEPVATETERPVDPLIFDRWLHAHEEDSGSDRIETYRPSDHPFPVSRGRKGFEIHEDGRFVELSIAPADGTLEHQGQWTRGEDRRLDVRLENGTSYALEIVDVEEGSLKVRRG